MRNLLLLTLLAGCLPNWSLSPTNEPTPTDPDVFVDTLLSDSDTDPDSEPVSVDTETVTPIEDTEPPAVDTEVTYDTDHPTMDSDGNPLFTALDTDYEDSGVGWRDTDAILIQKLDQNSK
jgi:hypothetical protein